MVGVGIGATSEHDASRYRQVDIERGRQIGDEILIVVLRYQQIDEIRHHHALIETCDLLDVFPNQYFRHFGDHDAEWLDFVPLAGDADDRDNRIAEHDRCVDAVAGAYELIIAIHCHGPFPLRRETRGIVEGADARCVGAGDHFAVRIKEIDIVADNALDVLNNGLRYARVYVHDVLVCSRQYTKCSM